MTHQTKKLINGRKLHVPIAQDYSATEFTEPDYQDVETGVESKAYVPNSIGLAPEKHESLPQVPAWDQLIAIIRRELANAVAEIKEYKSRESAQENKIVVTEGQRQDQYRGDWTAIQFRTRTDRDRAIDLFWTTPELRGTQRNHVGDNTIIVPTRSVEYFAAYGLRFECYPVRDDGETAHDP